MSFRVCTDLAADPRLEPRLAADRSKLWTPGQEIRISFLGGTETQQLRTMGYASEWLDHANLTFVWTDTPGSADIRIDFRRGDGSWSYIGTDALSIGNQRKPP